MWLNDTSYSRSVWRS